MKCPDCGGTKLEVVVCSRCGSPLLIPYKGNPQIPQCSQCGLVMMDLAGKIVDVEVPA